MGQGRCPALESTKMSIPQAAVGQMHISMGPSCVTLIVTRQLGFTRFRLSRTTEKLFW